jgi:uncharacterized protein YjbI with pentapeptide repeats
MADQQQLEILQQGAALWNQWRRKNTAQTPNLSGADLSRTYLREADLNAVDLREANLYGANLRRANLRKADLRWADLSEANLRGAYLSEADLRKANLRKTNFSGANFTEANLGEALLQQADLISVNLTQANLHRTNLTEADLSEADLSSANLSGANVTQANLYKANLRQANLSGAILRGTDLSGARFYETLFGATIFTATKGLDSCIHFGPSVIDHRTLSQSGPLPLAFLRGCGLPDRLIEYLPSLLNQAIQFYSCFISYSTSDQEFADRLHADLQNKGVRCWFAPHDAKGGRKLHEQIDEAIRLYDRLLLILSQDSMNSEWVKTEIANARKREIREKRQMLFPITLAPFESIKAWHAFDTDIGKDSAREIREYFIPDFSNWKDHDSYQKTFDQLLRDLKAEAARATPKSK